MFYYLTIKLFICTYQKVAFKLHSTVHNLRSPISPAIAYSPFLKMLTERACQRTERTPIVACQGACGLIASTKLTCAFKEATGSYASVSSPFLQTQDNCCTCPRTGWLGIQGRAVMVFSLLSEITMPCRSLKFTVDKAKS